jgi:hypothetical protein
MFYKAKVAVCSEIRTKHINATWAPRRIFLMLNLIVCKVTTRLLKVNININLIGIGKYFVRRYEAGA